MQEFNSSKLTKAILFCLACLFVCASLSMPSKAQEQEPKKKPALTIKQIMNKAHKPADANSKIYLLKKVATGKATAAESKELHGYYEKLAKLKPAKGDQASWDAKTKALVDAAKAAVDGDANFKTKLSKATNCAACHKVHK